MNAEANLGRVSVFNPDARNQSDTTAPRVRLTIAMQDEGSDEPRQFATLPLGATRVLVSARMTGDWYCEMAATHKCVCAVGPTVEQAILNTLPRLEKRMTAA
ncbi:MAG: hypothetical protein EON59_03790 [Alphaproteobacteria bacterium]|nr:MAG: hypothetical protein EON59_03790 [Alphaproteobacteria bacterium]